MPHLWQSAPIRWDAPLNRGLVEWWLAVPGRVGGLTYFGLTGRYPGTLTGMAAMSATSGWGSSTTRRGGFAEVRFAGVDDYIGVGALSVFDIVDTTCTVSGWFRCSNTGAQQYLMCKRQGGLRGWYVRIDSNNTFNTSTRTDSAPVAGLNSVATVTDGLWHHWVVVFTTDTVTAANNVTTLYLDGVLVGSGTGVANTYLTPTTGVLTFGTLSDLSASWLVGTQDDLRFWARGLSAVEVKQLYLAGQLGYPRELNWLRPAVMAGQFVGDDDGVFYYTVEAA